MRFPPALALALLTGFAAGPALAQDGTCTRDLLVAESLQRTAVDRLDATGSSEAAQCATWRQHVATMRRAAAIFGRCLQGDARRAKLAQTEGPAQEFDALVRQRCR